MKKTLALVLALVMVLCAVSAMAEGSKTVDDTQSTTVTDTTVTNRGGYYAPAAPALPTLGIVTPSAAAQAIIDQFKAAHDAGDDLGALPDDVKGQIGEGLVNVNEMIAVKFNGDTNVANEVEITLSFMTKYNAGDDVAVLIGELDGENVKWTVLNGKVNDAGDVVVKVPVALVKGLENNEFLIAVVSK